MDKVVDSLHDALTAEKPLMYRGEGVDFVPDWNVRHKACVQVFKIIGAYRDSPTESSEPLDKETCWAVCYRDIHGHGAQGLIFYNEIV